MDSTQHSIRYGPFWACSLAYYAIGCVVLTGLLWMLPYPCLTPDTDDSCTAWQGVQGRPVTLTTLALLMTLPALALAWAQCRPYKRRLTPPEKNMLLASTVFQSTQEAILITDADLNIIAVNPAFTKITGFSLAEVIGRKPRIHRSDRFDERYADYIWSCIRQDDHWRGEIWNRRKNGELFPALENISAVRDRNGEVTHYVSLMSDISAIKQVEDRLNHLAHHDPLTGLSNRLAYTSHLESALERAKRHNTKVALLFLDLDRFKAINDSLGHASGDLLLKTLAQRLRHCVRGEDMVARLGGDEFTIVMEGIAHSESAGTLAHKITRTIQEPVEIEGHPVTVSTSVGIALFPDDAKTADSLVQAADKAMYRAKSLGRNTYEFFTSEMVTQSRLRVSIENALLEALNRNELALYYQPQFSVVNQDIVGVEALLRWHHPQWGTLLPDQFLTIAEDSGLMAQIGDWVIHSACEQIAHWQRTLSIPLRLTINITDDQLTNGHLLHSFRQALLAHELEPGDIHLGLDITENLLQAGDKAMTTLSRLRGYGVTITIDDFGTGYSSLGHLKQLPIDALKIDPVFLKDLPFDTDNYSIAAAIISMGHSLGMSVIAEGVETDEQLAFLELYGCDVIQGFLYGKPLPLDQTTALLSEYNQRAISRFQ